MNIGSLIGRYRIIRELAAGGMGRVFLGEHVLLERRAAIKTLRPELSAQKDVTDRFFHEARATSAIADPGVVQIFDFGYHVDGTAYIVMELIDGESLADRIERFGTLPVAHALRIARQVAASLSSAHACGVVHRDLKPANIFLVRDTEAQGGERTKVFDFGICKQDVEGQATLTQDGFVFGTPAYMSPEQCRGESDIDRRADVYALGCVLFHMLTGRPPFEHESVTEVIAAHLRDPAPAPSSTGVAVPPEVDALVLTCLAKSRDDRFESVDELQGAIEPLLDGLPDVELAPYTPPARPADDDQVVEHSPRLARASHPARRTSRPPPGGRATPSLELEAMRPRRAGLIAGLAAVLIAAGVITFALWTVGTDVEDEPAPAPEPVALPAGDTAEPASPPLPAAAATAPPAAVVPPPTLPAKAEPAGRKTAKPTTSKPAPRRRATRPRRARAVVETSDAVESVVAPSREDLYDQR